VELTVLRLTKPEVSPDVDSLSARLAHMERTVRHLERGVSAQAPAPVPAHPAEELPTDRPFTSPADPAPHPPGTRREAEGSATGDGDEPDAAAAPDAAVGPDTPQETSHQTPAATAPPSAVEMTLADFERIWPSVVARIRTDVGPRRHALLREATPVEVRKGTVVFEVAAHMHFHLEQLKADDGLAAAISQAASDQLGAPIAVSYRSADAPVAAVESDAPVPDKDDLTEQSGADDDPTRTVVDLLGAEVISDSDSA
jgi:hypothetical protein